MKTIEEIEERMAYICNQIMRLEMDLTNADDCVYEEIKIVICNLQSELLVLKWVISE